MESGIQAVQGPSDFQLNCSFTEKPGDVVLLITLKALRDSMFKTIATFTPSNIGTPPAFTPDGSYLIGRANLTNPTIETRTATLTFFQVECEDETDYQCEVNYQDGLTGTTPPMSLPFASTNVTVKGN